MNIDGITDNLRIKIFTPKTPWEKIRGMSTGAELMVSLITKGTEKPSDGIVRPSSYYKIDITV
jgi:hypothetical protein